MSATRGQHVSAASGEDRQDGAFAEVMRAVFHPAQHGAHRLPVAIKGAGARKDSGGASSASAPEAPPPADQGPTAQSTGNTNAEPANDGSVPPAMPSSLGKSSDPASVRPQFGQRAETGDHGSSRPALNAYPDSSDATGNLPVLSQPMRAGTDPASKETSVVTVVPGSAMNGGAVSIAGSLHGSTGTNTAGPANLDNSGKNELSGNFSSSSARTRTSILPNASSSDAENQMASPPSPVPFGSELDTKGGSSLVANPKVSALSAQQVGKRPAVAVDEGGINPIHRTSASGNHVQAADCATDATASTGEAEDAGVPLARSPKNLNNENEDSAVASVSPNATDPSSGNPSNADNRSGIQNNNGSAAAPQAINVPNHTAGAASPATSMGQNISSAIVPATTGARSELPRGDMPALGIAHAEPGLAATSNSANSPVSLTHAISSTASHGTAPDTFIAMDGGAAADHGVLLHAAPHQISVGVSDPALGWVEVRAERVDGQIAAALTAHSMASHAALTSIVPSMTTYLQEHHPGIQQVHVETGFSGQQMGAGSQGQSHSQGNAAGAQENLVFDVASARNIATEQTPSISSVRSARAGHQVSIRA